MKHYYFTTIHLLYDIKLLDIFNSQYLTLFQHHPDKVDPAERERATKKFQLLHLMYTLLKDEDRRQEYLDHGTLDDEEVRE